MFSVQRDSYQTVRRTKAPRLRPSSRRLRPGAAKSPASREATAVRRPASMVRAHVWAHATLSGQNVLLLNPLILILSNRQPTASGPLKKAPPSVSHVLPPTRTTARPCALLAPARREAPGGGRLRVAATARAAPAAPAWIRMRRATSTKAARRTFPATARLWWDQRSDPSAC